MRGVVLAGLLVGLACGGSGTSGAGTDGSCAADGADCMSGEECCSGQCFTITAVEPGFCGMCPDCPPATGGATSTGTTGNTTSSGPSCGGVGEACVHQSACCPGYECAWVGPGPHPDGLCTASACEDLCDGRDCTCTPDDAVSSCECGETPTDTTATSTSTGTG